MIVKKKKLIDVCLWILSILLFFSFGNIYQSIPGNFIAITVGISALFAFIVMGLYLINGRISQKKLFILICYLFMAVIFLVFRNGGSKLSYITLLINFPFVMLLMDFLQMTDNIQKFISYIVKIIFIFAIISLFFWFFGSIFRIIKPTGKIISSWGDFNIPVNSFYNIYFEPQKSQIDLGFLYIGVRNCSIFPEAPMANFVYTSGLLLNEYYSDNTKKLYSAILILMILSTLSTTGIIVVILHMIIQFFTKKNKNYIVFLFKIIFSIAALLLGAFIILKLFSNKMETYSGNVRYEKIMVEFDAFLQHPIIGNGFNTYTKGSSNSFTSLLADGGLFLWGIYYIPILGNIIFDLTSRNKKIYRYILFLFMFSITACQYNMFTIFIILLNWKIFKDKINFIN